MADFCKGSGVGTGVRSAARNPFGHAAAGLASVLMASSASAQNSIELPQVDVGAQGGGYQTTDSSLGRLPTPLRDTPQTVTVVPQTVIQEQNAATVKDALRNVAGISFRAGEGGNQGDTPYIRGFSAQSDIFRDGVRDPGWYTRDAFSIDAVEVFKGPSSFLFGRGSTGGIVNLVTKAPQDRNFVDTAITANSGPGFRATLDANNQLNENVSARLNVVGQKYDIAGRDHVEENRFGASAALKFKLNDASRLTVSYVYQHDTIIPDYGVPFLSPAWGIPRAPAPVAHGTWYGILTSTDPDIERVNAHIATARYERDINSQVKLTNTTRYVSVDRFQRNVFPEPNANVPPPPTLDANWQMNRAQVAVTNTLAANQTDITARFATGWLQHMLATGLDLTRETRDFLRNNYTTAGGGALPGMTNFLDPDPYRFPGMPAAPAVNQKTYGVATNAGAYIADQVKLNQYFELMGGVRFDSLSFAQDAPLAAPIVQHLEHTDNLVSYRVGGVFHPTPNSSVYAMHGTSYNPSADQLTINVGTNAAGNANAMSLINLPPEKNETTEVGVKTDVLGGRLSLASAVFYTEKTNLRVLDPATSSFTTLQGVVTAKGFEASAVGKLTDQWAVIATYTYVHARITKTTIATQLNNEPMNTPASSFSLWTTYDVTPQLQVGAGAFYVGAVWGDLPNTARVPDYWRFDVMAAYKLTPKSTVQFNIYNLTDKYYYASAYSNWAVPGPSRTFAVTYRTSW